MTLPDFTAQLDSHSTALELVGLHLDHRRGVPRIAFEARTVDGQVKRFDFSMGDAGRIQAAIESAMYQELLKT